MITRTKAEVQDQIQVSVDFEALLKVMPDAERKYLKPFLGDAFYNELDAAYSGGYTAVQQKVVDAIHSAMSALAMVEFVSEHNVMITESGVNIFHDENTKSAFQWQVEDYKRTMLNRGLARVDNVLDVAEANKASFPTYTGSEVYTSRKGLFVPSAEIFSAYFSRMNGRRAMYLLVQSYLKEAQEDKILPTLTETLHDELVTQLQADNVSADNKKLLPLIRKAMVYQALADAVPMLGLGITPYGINVSNMGVFENIKGENPAPEERVTRFLTQAQAKANSYLAKLQAYLDMNADNYDSYDREDPVKPFDNKTENKFFYT